MRGNPTRSWKRWRPACPWWPRDIPGNRDLVVPGETGYLVRVGHRAGFARWTNQLLDDAALQRRLGQAGRQRVGREFSVEAMVSRYVDLYGEGGWAGDTRATLGPPLLAEAPNMAARRR